MQCSKISLQMYRLRDYGFQSNFNQVWTHPARSAAAEDIGGGQQCLRESPAAHGAGGGGGGATAGLV